MIITKKFTMALDRRGVAPVVDAVQDDGLTRAVEITLTYENQPWEIPSDATAAIRFRKSDGKSGLYDTLPNEELAYTISGNVVTVVLAPEVLTAEGSVDAAVVLYQGTQVLGLFPFIVLVAPNPAGSQSISNNYYYLQTWNDVNAAIGQVNGLATADKTSLVAAINEVAGKAGKGGLVCKVTFDLLYPVGVVVTRPVSELSRAPEPGEMFATLCAGRYYTVFKVTTVGGDTYAASVIHSAEISANVDLSGYVQSINGVGPDENGNVEITIPDSSQNANGLSTEAAALLIATMRNSVYSTDQSANITALENALASSGGDSGGDSGDSGETEKTLTSISATYGGGDVPVGTSVYALTGIVVTASYDDGSTATLTGYTLSGEIAKGSNTITVTYGGMTTTFTVTGVSDEEEPTGTLIHSWDFTQSLTDSVGGLVAVFGTYGTPTIAQDSTGLHFAGANDCCLLGDIMAHETDFKPRRVEIDVSNVNYYNATGRGRLFMSVPANTTGAGNANDGLIYDSSKWRTYFGGWTDSAVSGAGLISGKKLIVKQPEPFVYEFYADDTLLHSVTRTADAFTYGVQIGSALTSFYNIDITAVRVYEEV